jgi:peptidylprolyl isomerase
MNRFVVFLCLLGMFVNVIGCNTKEKGDKMIVEKGKQVSFEYTLTVDGEVVDKSEGKPLQYKHGDGQIIPGLAEQLEGLKVGDEKVVEVDPDQAYGKVDPNAFRDVPKTVLPADLTPAVGMILQMQGPTGQALPVKIAEIKEESVVLDLNHPLAGKKLVFSIKIVSIE